MSYKLADGTLSTDYKIGDEFRSNRYDEEITLTEDDGSDCPFFTDRRDNGRLVRHWEDLTPIKSNNSKLISLLRSTIKQIEQTIQEMER